ncbi:MAG: ArnT family glycosyltransferase [Leptolyngbyaceae cyanobacterium]
MDIKAGSIRRKFVPLSGWSALRGVLWTATAVFLLLRFIHLSADFPSGITYSATLYTDEGWYASAAVRHYLFGDWYLANDFNAAVNMPVGQILHRLAFTVLGSSFFSARITTAAAFVLIVGLLAGLVYRRWGSSAALLAALLLATNYTGFAYSRLAIMEMIAICFVVAGIFVALGIEQGQHPHNLLLAAALFAAGILTKPTMAFAVILLPYFAWRYGKTYRDRTILLLASGGVILTLVGGYHLTARLLFPEDYVYFGEINLGVRSHAGMWAWFRHLPEVARRSSALGKSFVGMATLIIFLAIAVSQKYRRDPLFHVFSIYTVVYTASLTVVTYGPPRYYLPLLVPLAALCAVACIELGQRITAVLTKPSSTVLAAVPIVLVVGLTLHGSSKIIPYIANPSFSYVQMAHEMSEILETREGEAIGTVVFGHLTDTVAIETGIRSINTRLTTTPLDQKLRAYRPEYLVIHADEDIIEAVTAEGGQVEELASWDVFDNYYADGQPVRLMQVIWN